jgi:hypothetical protein
MKNIKFYQAQYLAHRRRFLAQDFKPMTLSAFYDAVYAYTIEVPVFLTQRSI